MFHFFAVLVFFAVVLQNAVGGIPRGCAETSLWVTNPEVAKKSSLSLELGEISRQEDLDFIFDYYQLSPNRVNREKLGRGLDALSPGFSFKQWALENDRHPRVAVFIEMDIAQFSIEKMAPSPPEAIDYRLWFFDRKTGLKLSEANRTLRISGNYYRIDNTSFNRFKAGNYPGIASIVYQATENMLRRMTSHLPNEHKMFAEIEIPNAANGGFGNKKQKGAIVWAKHRYDWYKPETMLPMVRVNL